MSKTGHYEIHSYFTLYPYPNSYLILPPYSYIPSCTSPFCPQADHFYQGNSVLSRISFSQVGVGERLREGGKEGERERKMEREGGREVDCQDNH